MGFESLYYKLDLCLPVFFDGKRKRKKMFLEQRETCYKFRTLEFLEITELEIH